MLVSNRVEICRIGDPGAARREFVGGKAAALSILAADFAVPPGFCLPVGWGSEESLAPGRPERAALMTAYAGLGDPGAGEPTVAVRSSATDEDGEEASFAGQHESFLNVRGEEQLLEAIRGCWESGRSERASAYRQAQGLRELQAPLPVLVQRLVLADASAVVFTANPLTGRRDEVVVNASWGLGESIVGGSVTPDAFVLRRPGLEIVGRQIAPKRRMTVAVPGGTREVGVPPGLRSRPSVDDGQVAAMATLALALEARFGRPQDIECCWAGGELFLLQSRPVTVLPIQREDTFA